MNKSKAASADKMTVRAPHPLRVLRVALMAVGALATIFVVVYVISFAFERASLPRCKDLPDWNGAAPCR